MKISSLILFSALSLSFSSVYAQVDSRPVSIGDNALARMGQFVGKRLSKLDVGAMISDMERAGVKSTTVQLSIDAEGSLIYNNDIGHSADKTAVSKMGRDMGMQLAPFKLRLVGNQLLAQFSAITFKNMNAYRGVENGHIESDLWSVVDSVKGLEFTFDRNFSNSDLDIFALDFVGVDGKVDILGSGKANQYLAIKFGGSMGMHTTKTQYNNEAVVFKGGKQTARAGLEYNDSWGKSSLNIGMGATLTRYGDGENGFSTKSQVALQEAQTAKYDASIDKYKLDSEDWKTAKKAYEMANSPGGKTISDESFAVLGNRPKPTQPSKPDEITGGAIERVNLYLNPSIEYSVKVSGNGAKTPVTVGVRVQGNIPMKDSIKHSEVNKNLTGTNRETVRAGVFIKF